VDVLKSVWDGFCQLLAPVFEGAFQQISNILSAVLDVITGLLDVFIGIFTGNWSQAWTGVKEIFGSIWDFIKNAFTTILNTLRGIADVFLGWFGTSWNQLWTSVSTFFSNIWNSIKITATTIWNGIKTAISTVVDGIKTKITTVFNSVKSTVSSVFDGIKSTATSVWNGIKSAITTPIEAAKNTVKSALDKISSFFSGCKLQLPHIKLPHFSISGSLSISPPSVPHLSVDWYKNGGIMTSPTIFGMNGSSLMAGGEAGQEAILPLKGFYDNLENILTSRLDMSGMEKYLAVIAANSSKGIYLEDGTLVGHLLPSIDSQLGQTQKLNRRLSL
jgi:hypothetical protein